MDAIRAANRATIVSLSGEFGEPSETNAESPSDEQVTIQRPQRMAKNAVQKKQLELALKAEKDFKLKIYKTKYDKYLEAKPKTNSAFDTLIAAVQVVNCPSALFQD